MSNNNYVYIYFRLNGAPCYVGKGSGNRWIKHTRVETNKHLNNLIKQAAALGKELPVVIIRDGLTNEQAFEIEEAFISALGRECDGGCLVNQATGGKGGSSGVTHGEEFREKRRAHMLEFFSDPANRAAAGERMRNRPGNNLGRKLSPEWRANIGKAGLGRSAVNLGIPHTEATKAKLSAALKGRPKSPEWRAAQSERQKGRRLSDATRAKISEAAKGRVVTDATRAKLSTAGTGKKRSEEFKKANSERLRGNKFGLGHKHTPEAIEKMRAAKALRDATSPPYRHSPETREKMRLSKLARDKKAREK